MGRLMCVVDFDPPDFYVERDVRARKPHACYECERTVPVGATYRRINAQWDGRPSSYVHCADCAQLGDAVLAADCSWLFGSLIEDAEQTISPLGDHVDSDPVALGTVAGLLFRIREARS
jgi:hypothetical protein